MTRYLVTKNPDLLATVPTVPLAMMIRPLLIARVATTRWPERSATWPGSTWGHRGGRTTFYSVSGHLTRCYRCWANRMLYSKNTPAYREVRLALGNGMLTSEDEVWHRQRRCPGTGFHSPPNREQLRRDHGRGGATTGRRWTAAAAAGEPVDAHAAMIEVTSRIIGRILLADMSAAIPRIMRVAFVNEAVMMRGLVPACDADVGSEQSNAGSSRGLGKCAGWSPTSSGPSVPTVPSNPRMTCSGLLLEARDDQNSRDRLSDRGY